MPVGDTATIISYICSYIFIGIVCAEFQRMSSKQGEYHFGPGDHAFALFMWPVWMLIMAILGAVAMYHFIFFGKPDSTKDEES